MASSPMMPVSPTSSIVARPWNCVSLPPGMATPTDLAPDLAHHSPLLVSLGVILSGFSRNIPPDHRIHLISFGSSPFPAVLKKWKGPS
eukprot:14544994-Heterocapsa_arctica.AAC.1